MKKLLISLIMAMLCIGSVFAVPIVTLSKDQDFRGTYSLYNVKDFQAATGTILGSQICTAGNGICITSGAFDASQLVQNNTILLNYNDMILRDAVINLSIAASTFNSSNYYNKTVIDASQLAQNNTILSLGNWSLDKQYYYNKTEIDASQVAQNNTINALNQSLANITLSNYYNKTQIDAKDAIQNTSIESRVLNATLGNYYTITLQDARDLIQNTSIMSRVLNTSFDASQLVQNTSIESRVLNSTFTTIGNWTADKGSYYTTTQIDASQLAQNNTIISIGNWTADKVNYYNTTLQDARDLVQNNSINAVNDSALKNGSNAVLNNVNITGELVIKDNQSQLHYISLDLSSLDSLETSTVQGNIMFAYNTTTLTVYNSNSNILITNIGGLDYYISGNQSVDYLSGTDSAPVSNYMYFAVSGNTTVLTRNAAYPDGIAHIDIAQAVVGSVGNYYYASFTPTSTKQFVYKTYDQARNNFEKYISGFNPTVNSTYLSFTAGEYWDTLHEVESLTNLTMTTDGFYIVLYNGTFVQCTSLACFTQYNDGNAIAANAYFNVLWGVIPTSDNTSRIIAIPQNRPGSTYTSASSAEQDNFNTITDIFNHPEITKANMLLIKTIVRNSADTFSAFSSGSYYKSIVSLSAAGAAAGGTNDHALLTNLDYNSSGHTGFASTSYVDAGDLIQNISIESRVLNTTFVTIGNWSADKSSYYNSTLQDARDLIQNTSIASKVLNGTVYTTGEQDARDLIQNTSIASRVLNATLGNYYTSTVQDARDLIQNTSIASRVLNATLGNYYTSTVQDARDLIQNTSIASRVLNATFDASQLVQNTSIESRVLNATLTNNYYTSTVQDARDLIQNTSIASRVLNTTLGSYYTSTVQDARDLVQNTSIESRALNTTVATKAVPGNCSEGYFVQNTTTGGVQCVLVPAVSDGTGGWTNTTTNTSTPYNVDIAGNLIVDLNAYIGNGTQYAEIYGDASLFYINSTANVSIPNNNLLVTNNIVVNGVIFGTVNGYYTSAIQDARDAIQNTSIASRVLNATLGNYYTSTVQDARDLIQNTSIMSRVLNTTFDASQLVQNTSIESRVLNATLGNYYTSTVQDARDLIQNTSIASRVLNATLSNYYTSTVQDARDLIQNTSIASRVLNATLNNYYTSTIQDARDLIQNTSLELRVLNTTFLTIGNWTADKGSYYTSAVQDARDLIQNTSIASRVLNATLGNYYTSTVQDARDLIQNTSIASRVLNATLGNYYTSTVQDARDLIQNTSIASKVLNGTVYTITEQNARDLIQNTSIESRALNSTVANKGNASINTGTSNTIAMFQNGTIINNSIMTQTNAASITVTGNLSVTENMTSVKCIVMSNGFKIGICG